MARDILRERGLAFGPSVVDDPTADAAHPTIEEQLLASDEPLRVRALPDFATNWGIFLGEKLLWRSVAAYLGDNYAETMSVMAAMEHWRKAIREQLDAAETERLADVIFAQLDENGI